MRLAKRTYSLPPEVLEKFEARIAAGQRSPILAGLMREWVEEKECQELRKQIVEGCREMAETYLAVDREWASASDEIWRNER